jgi:hypothetical protein
LQGKFEAGFSYDKHIPDRHLESENRQNPLTGKLKKVFESDVTAKHRRSSVKTRNYLWPQPVLPNKYLGFPTQITESVNNNSVILGILQTFSQNIAVNFVRKSTIMEKLT